MKLRKDKKGMVGAIAAVVSAMVVIAIAVIITEELITAQYTNFGLNASDPTQAVSDVDLQAGFNSTRSLSNAGLTIMPVVILVLAALPVVAAVYLLGRR